jgi:2,4-dichlorophenol 6-monooxygenase
MGSRATTTPTKSANTGVQDVHNLVWKLATVEAGSAPDALLDTYEIERRPVAQDNADQSLRNALRLLEVVEALGATSDPEASRAAMSATLDDPEGRARVAAAIERQRDHFDMLGLQLGYVYDQGALLDDGSAKPAPSNPVRELVPTSRPGARLPHGWIERDGRRISTLDLVSYDGLTLLVGPRGGAWLDAARGIEPSPQIVRIGSDVDDRDGWWTKIAEMEADGALLVRPDQHVAFRSRRSVANPGEMLRRAARAAVGR